MAEPKSHEEVKAKALENPIVKKEYDKLEGEFRVKRARAELGQMDLYLTYDGYLSAKDIDQIFAKVLPLIEQARKEGRRTNTKVICLCGSTRFTDIMLTRQWELTKQGFIVVSWCALPDGYFQGKDKAHIGDQEGVKEIVDEVHLRKIDLADEVEVINKGGYIGESTQREIEYAEKIGKPIKYFEALKSKLLKGELK